MAGRLITRKYVKYFKENIRKIFWGCLLLPMWNAIVNMG